MIPPPGKPGASKRIELCNVNSDLRHSCAVHLDVTRSRAVEIVPLHRSSPRIQWGEKCMVHAKPSIFYPPVLGGTAGGRRRANLFRARYRWVPVLGCPTVQTTRLDKPTVAPVNSEGCNCVRPRRGRSHDEPRCQSADHAAAFPAGRSASSLAAPPALAGSFAKNRGTDAVCPVFSRFPSD